MRTFDQAGQFLGTLERRVMEVLWTHAGPMAVRDVCGRLEGGAPPAYTTVMTTLDRLYKKGLLERHKDGTAFRYEPAMGREAYCRRIVESTVSGLIEQSSDLDPVLAAFVEAAADVDEDNLERLAALIDDRRKGGR